MQSDISHLDSKYSWRRLILTLWVSIIANVGVWAIVVIMPAVQNEFGVDRGTVSLPYALTMVGFGLGNLFFGRIVDRNGAFVALIIGILFVVSGFFISIIVDSMLAFIVVQMVVGFGTGASFGPLIADISQWFYKKRGLAVSIVASGNYLAGAVWPILLSGVLEESGWRAVYLSLICLLIIGALPIVIFLRKKAPAVQLSDIPQKKMENFKINLSKGSLTFCLALAGFCCCVAMSMPQVHMISYCYDLGFGQIIGGQLLSLMLLGGVLSRVISGFIVDILGGIKTVLIGSSLQAFALFLFLPFDGLISLYIVSLVFGLSQGGIVPSYAIIVREFLPSGEAGVRIGTIIMTTIIGMAFGGWLSGWLFDLTGSYKMAFYNGIVWNVANILIMLLLFGKSSFAYRKQSVIS